MPKSSKCQVSSQSISSIDNEILAIQSIYGDDLSVFYERNKNNSVCETILYIKMKDSGQDGILRTICDQDDEGKFCFLKKGTCIDDVYIPKMILDIALQCKDDSNVSICPEIYLRFTLDSQYPDSSPEISLHIFHVHDEIIIKEKVTKMQSLSDKYKDVLHENVLFCLEKYKSCDDNKGRLMFLSLEANKRYNESIKFLSEKYKRQLRNFERSKNGIGCYASGNYLDKRNNVIDNEDEFTIEEVDQLTESDEQCSSDEQKDEILQRRRRIRNVSFSASKEEINENCQLANNHFEFAVTKLKTNRTSFSDYHDPACDSARIVPQICEGVSSSCRQLIKFGNDSWLTIGSISMDQRTSNDQDSVNSKIRHELRSSTFKINEIQLIFMFDFCGITRPLTNEKSMEYQSVKLLIKKLKSTLKTFNDTKNINVCKYRSIDVKEVNSCLSVNCIRQFIHGISLRHLINTSFTLPIWTIRAFGIKLIDMASSLHKKQLLLYKSLNLDNIIVSSLGDDVFLLDTHYILGRLRKMHSVFTDSWSKYYSTSLADLKRKGFSSQLKLYRYEKRFDYIAIAILMAILSIGQNCESLIVNTSSTFSKCAKLIATFSNDMKIEDRCNKSSQETDTRSRISKKRTHVIEKTTKFYEQVFNMEESRAFNKFVPYSLRSFIEHVAMSVFDNCINIYKQVFSHEFLRRSKDDDVEYKTECSKDAGFTINDNDTFKCKLTEKVKLKSKIELTKEIGNTVSRFQNDFSSIERLGSGGFGYVVKVKNLLDGNLYAIKIIKLKSINNITRKLTREVKLLSRLNHENVVRYYQSWIEHGQDDESFESDTSDSYISQKNTNTSQSFISSENDYDCLRNDKTLMFVDKKVKCKKSLMSPSSINVDMVLTDSDDEIFSPLVECNMFDKYSIKNSVSSEFIEFRRDSNDVKVSFEKNDKDSRSLVHVSDSNSKNNFNGNHYFCLYIQMEFCDKQTLRHLIDLDQLPKQKDRIWSLLRGILEGLGYIHEQQMIHRDLKPSNIFLDKNDRIKIGDFGLATSTSTNVSRNFSFVSNAQEGSVSMTGVEVENMIGSLTGNVGTAYYVSPEVISSANNAYNSKVDMYALGIMLFEMSYRKMNTGMERSRVLGALRQKSIILPSDYDIVGFKNHSFIIKKLLDWCPKNRPSADQLLQNDVIPNADSLLAFDSLLQSALRNHGSPSNRLLLRRLFTQEHVTLSGSSHYLKSFRKNPMVDINLLLLKMECRDIIESVFKSHGAVTMLNSPILSPHTCIYDRDFSTILVEKTGLVVQLPYDLRFCFALHLSTIDLNRHGFKRYTIDRIFRERKVSASHPQEILRATFDSVNFSNPLIIKFELFKVFNSLIKNLNPNIPTSFFSVVVNHRILVESMLLCVGLSRNNTQDFFKQMSTSNVPFDSDKAKSTILSLFQSFDVSVESHTKFYSSLLRKLNLVENYSLNKTPRLGLSESDVIFFNKFFSQQTNLRETFFNALDEAIEAVEIYNMYFKGYRFQLNLSLLFNCHLYSKFFFQISSSNVENHMIKIASGGMYEKLLEQFTKSKINQNEGMYVGGISLNFDVLVGLRGRLSSDKISHKFAEVALCVYSNEKESIFLTIETMNLLFDNDISVVNINTADKTTDQIQEYCQHHNIKYCLILKFTKEMAVSYKLRVFEKEKVFERMLHKESLIPFLKEGIKLPTSTTGYNSPVIKTKSQTTEDSKFDVKVFSIKQKIPIKICFDHLSVSLNSKNDRRIRRSLLVQFSKYESIFSKSVNLLAIIVDVDMAVFSKLILKFDYFSNEKNFDEKCASFISSSNKMPDQKIIKNLLSCIKHAHFTQKYHPVIIYHVNDDLKFLM